MLWFELLSIFFVIIHKYSLKISQLHNSFHFDKQKTTYDIKQKPIVLIQQSFITNIVIRSFYILFVLCLSLVQYAIIQFYIMNLHRPIFHCLILVQLSFRSFYCFVFFSIFEFRSHRGVEYSTKAIDCFIVYERKKKGIESW